MEVEVRVSLRGYKLQMCLTFVGLSATVAVAALTTSGSACVSVAFDINTRVSFP